MLVLSIDHSVLFLPRPVPLPRRSFQSVTTHILACSEFSCCLGFPGPLTRVVHIAPTIRILLLCSAVLLFPAASLRAPSYHHPWLSCSHAHIRARTVTSPTYCTSRPFGSYSHQTYPGIPTLGNATTISLPRRLPANIPVSLAFASDSTSGPAMFCTTTSIVHIVFRTC